MTTASSLPPLASSSRRQAASSLGSPKYSSASIVFGNLIDLMIRTVSRSRFAMNSAGVTLVISGAYSLISLDAIEWLALCIEVIFFVEPGPTRLENAG